MGWCSIWQECGPGGGQEEEGRGGNEGREKDVGRVQRSRNVLHC